MSSGGFTAGQAAKVTGLKYATVDYWDRSGFLSPSVAVAQGKGSDRVYNFQDLIALRVARQLREAGISLQALRKIVGFLRKRKGLASPLAETYLVTDGRDVYEKQGDGVLSVLRQPGQGCFFFVLDLSRTVAELREAVEKLVA
jgi:DNA-binding transcriptional MerR regulator